MTALSGTGLCERSVSFLDDVYSPELALFPYSTRVVDGRYVNDFRRAESIRYTINTLLGLQQFYRASSRPGEPVQTRIDAFLERRYDDIASYADLGLLLVLLRDQLDGRHATDALRRICGLAESPAVRRLEMQSLAWMLWGLTAVAPSSGDAQQAARRLFRTIAEHFVDPASSLPRHSLRLYRRNIVSFGAIVYFLRALHEYGALTGDDHARTLFRSGVERALALQGSEGEWPWLTGVGSGRPVEYYPVFAVHQDSMAMLFLLPALDEGCPGVREAIDRSFAWALGANELGQEMYEDDPFRAYRSIERTDAFPRASRYARALAHAARRTASGPAAGRRVALNPECRSYHLGWLLFAWADRSALLDEILGTPFRAAPAQPSLA